MYLLPHQKKIVQCAINAHYPNATQEEKSVVCLAVNISLGKSPDYAQSKLELLFGKDHIITQQKEVWNTAIEACKSQLGF